MSCFTFKNRLTPARLALALSGLTVCFAQADTRTIEDVGFATPESVEYDLKGDQYLVSNVNGHPLAKDGNGFISRLSPSGDVLELKWLESDPGRYMLHGPKGLAIADNKLFVADLEEVHVFQLPEGNYLNSIRIEGVSVLNGASPAQDGSVIVTDTGYAMNDENIAPSGTDALYQVWPDGRYQALIRDDAMGHPNGVYYVNDDEMLVVTFGSGELFRVDAEGKRDNLEKPPQGTLDGVEKLADGRILVSSWEGSAIYALDDDRKYTTVLDSIADPADLGFDSKRNRLLIPLTNSDQVVLHELQR